MRNAPPDPESQPPNVIVLVTHDTGRHLSPYGIPTVVSPQFERLAAESTRFTRCFAVSPLCSPSRSALFTSRYPHQNGVNGLCAGLHGWDLAEGETHAAQLFQAAGYTTVLGLFLHEALDWSRPGWDTILKGPPGPDGRPGTSISHAPPAVDEWLKSRDPKRPFYLQIGCHETHRDFGRDDTPPDSSRGITVPPYVNDTPEVREDLAALQGSIRKLDGALGELLDLLDHHQLTETTLLVVTTDHGIDLPGAKGCFLDPGLEVFLFLRFPRGGWPAGAVCDDLVSQIDLLPTLLEACGLPVPDNLEGRSLLPALTGRADEVKREVIFAEKTYHDCYDPTRALRTHEWKYIRYFDNVVINDLRIASVERAHWRKAPLFRTESEELYHLPDDPLETRNLAGAPECAGIRESLRRQLRDWMVATDDPLLKGPIPSPIYRRELADLMRD